MKRVSVALALLVAFGASTAQADRWVPRKSLPRPVDFPIVRKKVREDHKPTKRQHHPSGPHASLSAGPATQNA
jgi:hypothetical protein